LPHLQNVSFWSTELGKEETVAELFAFYGHFTSINPFVLVAFVEATNGDLNAIQSPAKFDTLDLGVEGNTFSERLYALAHRLATNYYARQDSVNDLQASSLSLTVALSNQVNDAPESESVSQLTARFKASFTRRFGDPLIVDPIFYQHEEIRRNLDDAEGNGSVFYNQTASVYTSPVLWNQSDMQLPWSVGGTWGLSGGPHNWLGYQNGSPVTTRPWSSIDFTPPDSVACPTSPSSHHAKASLNGHVYYVNGTFVKIAHWTETWEPRWESWYFHLSPVYVSYGQQVSPTTSVGRPSCLGGTTTGLHLHFGFAYNGGLIEANNRKLSGWTVYEGANPYGGRMTKGGTTIYPGNNITK